MNQTFNVTTIQKRVGSRLLTTRKAKGLSLRSVAIAIGICYSTLAKLEKGKHNPTLLTLERICKYYKVPLKDLFTSNPIR